MTSRIEISDQRSIDCDIRSNHPIREPDIVPMETTEPGNPHGRLRIAAILLALAVCIFGFLPGAPRIPSDMSRTLTYYLAVSVHRSPGYDYCSDGDPNHRI